MDGKRRTAGGNNIAAGRLMPINVRQKREILAGRPVARQFPERLRGDIFSFAQGSRA